MNAFRRAHSGMQSILSAVGREVTGMHEAAYLLAAFALLSQLLALVRDRLLAAHFGATHTLDLYYAAFRIPDFLFATVASLLSLYALLPVLSRLEAERPGLMLSFLRQALLWFFVGMGAVCAVAWLLAPELVALAAPGIHSPGLVMLVRILLLQPILLGASNILANLTQLRHRFVLYSVSPLLYNLGIIFGIMALYPRVGLVGLAWGVVLGALLHFLVQLPYFIIEPIGEPLPLKQTMRYLGEVLALSVPRTLALSAGQLSLFALTALASLLSPGSISVFMLAWNLQAVPLTIIGVSYSVAAFPTLSRLHAAGDTERFAAYIETALRHIIFWAVPASVFIVVLRAQLVRVILGAGAFDWSATRLVAAALALFVLSLAAQSVSLLIARVYYAAGNTKTPLYRGIIDIIVSVGSALLLTALFHESAFLRDLIEALLRVSDIPGTTVLMLALGYTLGAFAQCLVGFALFLRDFKVPTARVSRLLRHSLEASIIGGGVTYLVLAWTGMAGTINTAVGLVTQGLAAGVLGLCAAVGVLWLLGTPELVEIGGALASRLRDAKPVTVEPSDISS